MSAWTQWRKVADQQFWFDEAFDWDGPACYELALGGPRGGDIQIVYCGETGNEKRRVIQYASHGSHLSEIIHSHLREGWNLFYRAQSKNSKEEAVHLQNNLLRQYEYPWNVQLNGKTED